VSSPSPPTILCGKVLSGKYLQNYPLSCFTLLRALAPISDKPANATLAVRVNSANKRLRRSSSSIRARAGYP